MISKYGQQLKKTRWGPAAFTLQNKGTIGPKRTNKGKAREDRGKQGKAMINKQITGNEGIPCISLHFLTYMLYPAYMNPFLLKQKEKL